MICIWPWSRSTLFFSFWTFKYFPVFCNFYVFHINIWRIVSNPFFGLCGPLHIMTIFILPKCMCQKFHVCPVHVCSIPSSLSSCYIICWGQMFETSLLGFFSESSLCFPTLYCLFTCSRFLVLTLSGWYFGCSVTYQHAKSGLNGHLCLWIHVNTRSGQSSCCWCSVLHEV